LRYVSEGAIPCGAKGTRIIAAERMRQIGQVSVPQETFLTVLKIAD